MVQGELIMLHDSQALYPPSDFAELAATCLRMKFYSYQTKPNKKFGVDLEKF